MYKAVGLFSCKVGEMLPLGVNSKNVFMNKASYFLLKEESDSFMAAPELVVKAVINLMFVNLSTAQRITLNGLYSGFVELDVNFLWEALSVKRLIPKSLLVNK